MLHLHWQKTLGRLIILTLISVSASLHAAAQKVLYLEDHDSKPYYFGITLSAAQARFHTEHHPYFLQQDTVMVAQPARSGGFALGLLATARLSQRFEGRFNPQLMFAERNLAYILKYPDRDMGAEVTQKVESVIVTFPLQVKFRSDRIGNFRVYMLGGGKVDYDLASNARARKAESLVKIQNMDYGVEAGMGFNFYFQSFIFSPEVKISRGFNNIHSLDPHLKYSNVFDKIQSRMIFFSIHLEG